MSNASGLSDKRIIVTGSSMGIGQAVALRLASEGAKLVINARNPAAIDDTLTLIRDGGGEAIASAGSVANYDEAGALVQRCVEHYGGVDVLINCAGIAEPKGTSILNIDANDWQQVIDVHLNGTFNTCRHAAPVMVKQGSGTIINSSSHAFLGMYGGTAYAAGKGATNSLSYAMAADLKASGINVNVICPGAKTRLSTGSDFVQTIESLHQRGLLSDERRYSALNPVGPEYVAALYALLASDNARHITGQTFWGSGGYIGRFAESEQQLLASIDPQAERPWALESLAAALDL